jgi:hypothetical protein
MPRTSIKASSPHNNLCMDQFLAMFSHRGAGSEFEVVCVVVKVDDDDAVVATSSQSLSKLLVAAAELTALFCVSLGKEHWILSVFLGRT